MHIYLHRHNNQNGKRFVLSFPLFQFLPGSACTACCWLSLSLLRAWLSSLLSRRTVWRRFSVSLSFTPSPFSLLNCVSSFYFCSCFYFPDFIFTVLIFTSFSFITEPPYVSLCHWESERQKHLGKLVSLMDDGRHPCLMVPRYYYCDFYAHTLSLLRHVCFPLRSIHRKI